MIIYKTESKGRVLNDCPEISNNHFINVRFHPCIFGISIKMIYIIINVIFRLFDLLCNVSVASSGHDGTLPPFCETFHSTFVCFYKLLPSKHTIKRLICMDSLTSSLFLSRLQPSERFAIDQIVDKKLCLGAEQQPIYFSQTQWT